MRGRYFLNHKGNVPPLELKDKGILIVIIVEFLLFIVGVMTLIK